MTDFHQSYCSLLKAIRFLSVAGILLILSSCSDSASLEKDRKALMDLHDKEMAKMGQIFNLKEQLNALSDSVSSEEDKILFKERIDRLQEANESMMEWMRNYQEPATDMPADEQKAYFASEADKMKQVENLIGQSIDSAQIVLKNYQSK